MDITTPNSVCASSAAEEVCRLSPQKEEAQSCTNNLEGNTLQLEKTVSVNTPGVILSPHENLPMNIQPAKEKKCVKLPEVPAISERSGNTPDSPRSVSSFIQGNQETSPSLLYRCMNCAVCFLICFLSITCIIIPQFHMSTFNFLKTFLTKKLFKKDWNDCKGKGLITKEIKCYTLFYKTEISHSLVPF